MSDFRIIPLTRGLEAVVDAADYELLSAFKWYALSVGNGFYAAKGSGNRSGGLVLMHRLLCAAPQALQVDHINGDRLDNRRLNLRLCTQSQNRCNAGVRASNTSGFKGVSWLRKNKKWMAAIQAGGVAQYIGSFTDKAEAARAYDAAALRLHGAFARLNFPEAA